MAREYARIRISIAEDDEFEDLSPAAQWLYLRVLLPEPSLNYAGVCDWRPNRLLRKALGIDLAYILTSAAELEEQRYVLFDAPTEQALIRTYIRGDELLRNPKMALAVVSGYQETASDPLRAFIVSEIQRDKEEHPDYSSWTHEISKDAVARLLTKPNADAVQYTNQIVVPITNRITNSDPSPDYQSDSVGIPSHLSPNNNHLAPSTPSKSSGAVVALRPTGAEVARARIANAPVVGSVLARQIAHAYNQSLNVPLTAKLVGEISAVFDECLQAQIPPDAIAAGMNEWTQSDSWAPSQIPKFIHKAANRTQPTNGVGKPSQAAMSYQDAAEQLLAKVTTR